MDDPRNRQYTNGEITVFWTPSECIHATTCFRELIEVFNPSRRPWVNMNGASTEKIIEVVNKCPTRALEWKFNRDLTETERNRFGQDRNSEVTPETLSGNERETRPVEVRVMKNGPLVVQGSFKIIGPGGNELQSMMMTSFCRCGHSGIMPFCDGTHRKIGFKD